MALMGVVNIQYQVNIIIIQIYKFTVISYIYSAQTDFIETFESETQALARQCFLFQNGLNTPFMPTQQRPSRVLTELSTDQFYMIRQLNFQKMANVQESILVCQCNVRCCTPALFSKLFTFLQAFLYQYFHHLLLITV
ncbi:Hypothetical_protein [Hexamita inflata]|uniref:Hypothetical_protein n=1 Tax=Hexamita inflata TaxID=28002 RepID=A0AA86PHA3_9EUKA|nr:Hypothetical protein HINF_LOCUS25991 [Hexamita inflata]